jgi:hypothetical protein
MSYAYGQDDWRSPSWTGPPTAFPDPLQDPGVPPLVTPGSPAPAPSYDDPGYDEPALPGGGGGARSYPSAPPPSGTQQASMGTGAWVLLAIAAVGIGWYAWSARGR